MPKITIPVEGMHCAACQSRVQSALTQTAGVNEAAVNLMLNNATVAYDEARVQPEQLVEAIKSTGYGGSLPRPSVTMFDEPQGQGEMHRRELGEPVRKAPGRIWVVRGLPCV